MRCMIYETVHGMPDAKRSSGTMSGTLLQHCMPLPKAALQIQVSSTAKVLYACLLDSVLAGGVPDGSGILFTRFPIADLAAALLRSQQTVKRSLNELEQAGMAVRVRQGIGEVSHIYILLPKGDGA